MDECKLGSPCDGRCINTPGSYTCVMDDCAEDEEWRDGDCHPRCGYGQIFRDGGCHLDCDEGKEEVNGVCVRAEMEAMFLYSYYMDLIDFIITVSWGM